MFRSFSSIALLALTLALPTAAQAQIDSWQAAEAVSDVLGAGITAGQVRHLQQVPSAAVFDISFGAGSSSDLMGDQSTKLKIFAERNAAGVNQLRHALTANPVTRHTMAEHGVDVNRVDGVSIGSTGSLRFFIE